MDLSMRWLGDYVDLAGIEIHDFCEAMSLSGSKVEGYRREAQEVTGTVVGKILSVQGHPNADKLVVCQVEVGREAPVQIVTAATNVFAGALVPVALHGATLHGDLTIKSGKLRGEKSEGMFCSLAELGLTVHDFPYAIEDGILIIEESCEPGQDIKEALGLDDTVTEFELTSNRPDCYSVIGLAREASATFGRPMRQPDCGVQGGEGSIDALLQVEIENPALCTRYAAKMVKNVKIGPSPRWLRERLRNSGVRPINNIVDITNYVCLEYGHPMHAFDYRFVNGKKITARNAKPGEVITTLDGIERTLSPEMLVIADQKGPVAVAGVMGGEYSGVMNDTDTIVFEAACFEPVSVRKTARRLGLRTESSARFEKGLPAEIAYTALMRACHLVELLGAGEVVGGEIDLYPGKQPPVTLKLESDWINGLLGTSLSEEKMADILRALFFEVKDGMVTAPAFRTDIAHKSDLAEEVGRIYGYNNIPSTRPSGLARGKLTDAQRFERRAGQLLAGLGFDEIMTYSFMSPKNYDRLCLAADDALRKSVVIANPLGEDASVMRTTALPGLLEVVARNYNGRNPAGCFYELATEYLPTQELLPQEKNVATMAQYGASFDFFSLKGAVQALLGGLKCESAIYSANTENPVFHPGRCADITLGGAYLGTIGELHPAVCENFGIGTRVYIARLCMDTLLAKLPEKLVYTPLPRFPKVTRDLALVCDEQTPAGEIEQIIREAGGKLVEQVTLFDVYRSEQVGENKKSIAYSIDLRSSEKTLTDEDADGCIKRVLKRLEAKNILLRTMGAGQ